MDIFRKSVELLIRRQTNIMSAAFVIMATIVFSQILGLVRMRLLAGIFGASNTLGIYIASLRLPDLLFQVIISGALYAAFIPIFSDFLSRGKEKESYQFASTLIVLSLFLFTLVSVILFIFAEPVLRVSINMSAYFNTTSGYTPKEMQLMANLLRIVLFGQLLFIIGSYLSAILQSYHRFFIPGFAAALYNLGIIAGIVFLSPIFHIYAAAVGVVLGAFLFVLIQIPFLKNLGFSFLPTISLQTAGVKQAFKLLWPRTLSIAMLQIGSLLMLSLISFLQSPGRENVIFDYAQTLAFAPIALFGQAIAQAAFPLLARQKNNLGQFKETFLSSFTQTLYLVMPVSVVFLVLRIPVVRLFYGAAKFDWQATVLTGRTLAMFSISIFAQALLYLVFRAFYALHDTKTPLVVNGITTVLMLITGGVFLLVFHMGIASLAFAYSLASVVQVIVLVMVLYKKIHGFSIKPLFITIVKIFTAAFFTGFALYIPIKLLDQLVFDTTKTINLLLLTGISSIIGLSLYIFLSWLLNVKEAKVYLLLFKKLGNWREILSRPEEPIEQTKFS